MDSSAYRELPQTEVWVPYENRPAAWFIWNELYQVTIPYIQMLSIEELQQYGMPTAGDPGYDYGTANEMRLVMIPISEMVVYYSKGVQVSIVSKEDVKKIYERISDHLNQWKQNLEKSLNIGNAPLEDLKLMDRFANAVYEHAKYQFTDDMISSFITRRMDTRHSSLNDMVERLENSTTKQQQEEKDMDDRYPKRESMSDYFQPYRNSKKKNHTNSSKGMNSSKTSIGDFIGGVPQYNKVK
jgi:hypothetical protein